MVGPAPEALLPRWVACKAVDFIEACAAEPIGREEIVAASGASACSLYGVFAGSAAPGRWNC